jgi:histone H3/H4
MAGDSLVVRSKIKEYIKDLNVSGDFAQALSKKCEQLIKEACERAKANGRRTVQSRDL